MTCSSFERTATFSQIPTKLNLSVKIGKAQFQDYLTGIIENPQSYRILAGWVTYKKTHSVVSSYLQKHDVVASQQYTPNCKLFIFLVNSACHQWLDKLPIYTTTSQVEMVFFLVYKKRSDVTEALIRPVPIPVIEDTTAVYRLVSSNNKIGFKASELSRIKETSRVHPQQEEQRATAQVDGFFVDQGDDDDSQKPAKLLVQTAGDKAQKSNKLKSLIDEADRFKLTNSYTIDEDSEHGYPQKKINHYEEDSDQEGLDGGDDDNLGNANLEEQESGHMPSAGSIEGSRGGRPRTQQVFGDRTNFAVPRIPQYSCVGINMDEFVRKAVSQIVISPQLVSSLPLPKKNPNKRPGKPPIKLGLGLAFPM